MARYDDMPPRRAVTPMAKRVIVGAIITDDAGAWSIERVVEGYRVWHSEDCRGPYRSVALVPYEDGALEAADCVRARIDGGYYED